MPKIFKVLTTITAWVLFINGFVTLIAFYLAELYFKRVLLSLPIDDLVGLAVGVFSFIGGVLAMYVRRKME